ncbi:MAG TPA: hypothetical protein VGG10_06780 [Rhizomicrobium sp.]|jgi:hypothetical protein
MSRTLLSLAAAAVLWHGSALADSISLTLSLKSIAGQGDSLGTTQHWDGVVKKGDTKVGNFYILIRTDQAVALNDGLAQLWLIFPSKGGNTAPESVVIEGMHDYGTTDFKGSVSAASSKYSWARGATAVYTPKSPSALNLVIQGSFTGVTLP